MYRISKEFSFAMGHRLSLHEGLCKNIHGHNYTVVVGLKSDDLNHNGMVMDFSDLKNIVEHYLKRFDHAFMANKRDDELLSRIRVLFPEMKLIAVDYEPTAENMARDAYQHIAEELTKYSGTAEVDFVTMYETDKAQATFSLD